MLTNRPDQLARIALAARARYDRSTAERIQLAKDLRAGRYDRVDKPDRIERRVRSLPARQLADIASSGDLGQGVLYERIIRGNDLLDASFLDGGTAVARSVGRVVVRTSSGRPRWHGTGFLISERLLMTNNHVLPSSEEARSAVIEFDYRTAAGGGVTTPVTFELEPRTFFSTKPALDFAIVAVAARNRTGDELHLRGWCPLIEDSGKLLVGESVNIVQHPRGGPQQVALRMNPVTTLLDDYLHYAADTEPGSSGAPVFNDLWELAALHHAGVPDTDAQGRILTFDGTPWDGQSSTESRIVWIANEGTRISRIVAAVRDSGLDARERRLFEQAFQPVPDRAAAERMQSPRAGEPGTTVRLGPDGSATWTFPLRVTVDLGGRQLASGPSAASADPGPQDDDRPRLPVVTRPPSNPAGPPPEQTPLSQPKFDALTVTLKEEGSSEAVQKRELRSLVRREAKEVGVDASAWRLERVPRKGSHRWDLVPPVEVVVSVKQAWELTHRLRALVTEVSFAEPVFETLLDGFADRLPAAAAARESSGGDHESNLPFDWSPRLVKAPMAWQVAPRTAAGRPFGEGVLIAHPDSGYLDHLELWDPTSNEPNRVLEDRGRDFIDGGTSPKDPDGGGHGLGTGSVLMSSDNRAVNPRSVTGVAPRAQLVPLRVTKPHSFLPAPVLLWSGARRLRNAIYYAVDDLRCHVISISLGWLGSDGLRDAVRHARESDVIVCAAAGNFTGRLVVWPARYPETIALAGCSHSREKWSGSAHGPSVDFTAPAEDVWKAAKGGAIEPSSGTSFSAATTAGVAALWLAIWGRDHLLAEYAAHGDIFLQDVFRAVLRNSCTAPPPGAGGGFGVGIIDAERALQLDLPSPDAVRSSMRAMLERSESTALPRLVDGLGLERGHVDTVARMIGVPGDRMDEALAGVDDEALFHIVTSPELRAAFADEAVGDAYRTEATTARRALASASLSDELLRRLE